MKPSLVPLLFVVACNACGAHSTAERGSERPPSDASTDPPAPHEPRPENDMPPSQTLSRISLRFRDASTPPQYHRSYTIEATPGEVTATVDVYGTVIASDRYPSSLETWQELTSAAGALSAPEPSDDGWTGASAFELSMITKATKSTLTWTADLTPNSAELTTFAERMKQLAPNLAKLLETQYPQ